MRNPAVKILALMLLTVPVLAQDAVDKSSTFRPDACEFAVTFPEEPDISQRCETNDKSRCYDLISYNQVYGIDSSVKFRVTCSVVNEDMQKKYTREVMEATLRAMTRRSNVDTFDTTWREETDYRQAGLVGEGKANNLPNIYIAQLWMGKRSALSVEAELVGAPHEKADKLFSETLKSVHFVKAEVKE
ncbi:MAG: hypothetical protein ACT4OY_07105 [Alphaproteobacteria bacterium]